MCCPQCIQLGLWVSEVQQAVQAEDDETVCFSWVEWPDKATRDSCHARMQELMASGDFAAQLEGEMLEMPFDGARMIFGGFEPVIDIGEQQ